MTDKKQQLGDLRGQIAELDGQIVDLLKQRFELSRQIHRIFEEEGGQPEFSDRELLERIEERAGDAVPLKSLKGIFSQIAAGARAVERPTRVAYVGPEGNFCSQVVRDYFGAHATMIEVPTVPDVLDQVRRERASHGVFAFDSSVEGLTLPAISAMAETDLVFIAERTVDAVMCLMNATGNPQQIEKIYATAAGHAMCELFVEREFPGTTVLDVRSPAEAAELAKKAGSAAIVPEPTGRAAGLRILRENVGDEPELKYRFGVVGSRPTARSGADITCLLFSLDDAPGTLYQVLSHFAERGINLKKIQSRPVRGASWDYVFYVEVSGHATDRPVVTALEAVKHSTRYLKLLGSFPAEDE